MAHRNAELARKAGEALGRGDIDTFLTFHTDDVVQHIPGQNQLSGTYEGKDQFAKLFQRQFELLDGPPSVELHDVLATDDHVAVLAKQTFTRGGKSFTANLVVVIHVRDGKFSEIWLHPEDQYAADEFWS
jgi:ketosteroid isomerase-like protein